MAPVPAPPCHAVSQRRGWQGRLCPQVPAAAQRWCPRGQGGWVGGGCGRPHVHPAPQFILPHSRGSSHGQSRITRSAYPQGHYARMMPDSFRLWQRLEAEAGTSLYR